MTSISLMRFAPVAALALLLSPARSSAAPATAAPESTWTDYYRAARAAFAAGDLGAARRQFRRANAIVGGAPNAMYNLAAVEAQAGRPDSALAWLDAFAATGLVRDPARDTLFAPLRDDPRFVNLAVRIRANGAPLPNATLAARLGDPTLLPEDLAYDERAGVFYVSSIRQRRILAVDRLGGVRDFVPPRSNGLWGVYALGLDAARHRLWATANATRTIEAYDPADSGRSALLCFDTTDGRQIVRVHLPRDGRPHVLGDLAIGRDGTVFVTESLGGAVYALYPGRSEFEMLAKPGSFGSPQTPVVTPDGRRLLIPDYPRGIASLDVGTRRIAWLPKPRSLGASGIDGLYLYGTHLIAIQNGWSVKRILWLDLDPDLTRIERWRVLEQGTDWLGEPSHGVVASDGFYFLANTGWDRVNADEQLVTGADSQPPLILKLTMPNEP